MRFVLAVYRKTRPVWAVHEPVRASWRACSRWRRKTYCSRGNGLGDIRVGRLREERRTRAGAGRPIRPWDCAARSRPSTRRGSARCLIEDLDEQRCALLWGPRRGRRAPWACPRTTSCLEVAVCVSTRSTVPRRAAVCARRLIGVVADALEDDRGRRRIARAPAGDHFQANRGFRVGGARLLRRRRGLRGRHRPPARERCAIPSKPGTGPSGGPVVRTSADRRRDRPMTEPGFFNAVSRTGSRRCAGNTTWPTRTRTVGDDEVRGARPDRRLSDAGCRQPGPRYGPAGRRRRSSPWSSPRRQLHLLEASLEGDRLGGSTTGAPSWPSRRCPWKYCSSTARPRSASRRTSSPRTSARSSNRPTTASAAGRRSAPSCSPISPRPSSTDADSPIERADVIVLANAPGVSAAVAARLPASRRMPAPGSPISWVIGSAISGGGRSTCGTRTARACSRPD